MLYLLNGSIKCSLCILRFENVFLLRSPSATRASLQPAQSARVRVYRTVSKRCDVIGREALLQRATHCTERSYELHAGWSCTSASQAQGIGWGPALHSEGTAELRASGSSQDRHVPLCDPLVATVWMTLV